MKKLGLLTIILGISVGAHAVIASGYYQGLKFGGNTDKGVIKIVGENSVYVVAAKADDQIYDVQMIFGENAVGRFQPLPNQHVTMDVYRIDALGTYDGIKFRPCDPPDDVNESDCTPTRFPPTMPGRFLSLSGFLGTTP